MSTQPPDRPLGTNRISPDHDVLHITEMCYMNRHPRTNPLNDVPFPPSPSCPTPLANPPTAPQFAPPLPYELTAQVLQHVDPISAASLSRTNRATHNQVANDPPTALVHAHLRPLLAALRAARIPARHSTATLHALLLNDRCTTCAAHGALASLLDGVRVCHACMLTHPRWRVTTLYYAEKTYGRRMPERALPRLWTVPGLYKKRAVRVVSIEAVALLYGGDKREALQRCMPALQAEVLAMHAYKRAPALVKGFLDPGFFCRGCLASSEAVLDPADTDWRFWNRRTYSIDEFKVHRGTCEGLARLGIIKFVWGEEAFEGLCRDLDYYRS